MRMVGKKRGAGEWHLPIWNNNYNRPFCAGRFCFPNTDHVMIPRRLELLLCSLKRPRASMKMSYFERRYSPGYRHVMYVGKTK